MGIDVDKGKTEIMFTAENDIINSLRLLAEKTPVNVNPWPPVAIVNFACCSFTNDFSYLLARVDNVKGLNGLLFEIQNNCLENGYEKNIKCSFGTSGFDFRITFQNKVGGFVIGYNPRKYWQFFFGSLNSIGVKAMLENFENLDNDLQKHLIGVCKTCNGCLGCTKGGRNKFFAVKMNYPAARLRGIGTLHSSLFKKCHLLDKQLSVFFFFPLVLYVLSYRFFIPMLSYCANIIPISPEFATP